MTGKPSIEEKLLELFDTLSREFHSLSSSYQNIEENCKKLTDAERNINETKTVVIDINQSVVSTKEVWKRIDLTLQELLAYKNKLDTIPQQTIDICVEIQTVLAMFDEEFVNGIKSLKSYKQLQEDLKPIVKFSKIMTTPLGVLVAVVAFTLSIMAASFGIYKIAALFVPEKIEQKNDVRIEQPAKIENVKKDKGVPINPPASH